MYVFINITHTTKISYYYFIYGIWVVGEIFNL